MSHNAMLSAWQCNVTNDLEVISAAIFNICFLIIWSNSQELKCLLDGNLHLENLYKNEVVLTANWNKHINKNQI